MTAPLVVLIGPPAAGKSRIGKTVARDLGARFIDTDRVIVGEHGLISDIFAGHGEAYFRAIERETVRKALRGELTGPGEDAPVDTVLALGGGAILDLDTRAELADHRVALITVTAEAVRDRLATSRRPLLAGGMEAWERIANERRPIYEALASSVWDTSHRPVSHIAHELADWVRDATGQDATGQQNAGLEKEHP